MSEDGTTTAIFAIVLGTILTDYVLTLLSSLLNYRALDQAMPLEFDGIYKPDAYAESQRYTKAKTVHSLLRESFDLAVLLTFWLVFDGFELLDRGVRTVVPGEAASLDVGRGLLYMGTMVFAEGVLGLPWSIYFTVMTRRRLTSA